MRVCTMWSVLRSGAALADAPEIETDGESPVLRTRRVAFTLTLTMVVTVGAVPFAAAAEPVGPEVVVDEVALADATLAEVAADDRAVVEVDRDVPPGAEIDPDALAEAEAAAADAGPAEEGRRTGPLEAPIAFTSLWAELPAGLDSVTVRTSSDGRTWSGWTELEVTHELDAPDPGSAEAAGDAPRITDLHESGEARFVQVEADGDGAAEVVVSVQDVTGLNESFVARVARHLTPRGVPAEASTVPSWINGRATWGAAPYRGTPDVARDGVRQVVVHHTAGQNNLSSCDRTTIINTLKGIQSYHQNGQGWSDVGYNVLIDPCGGVWEGRQGGLDRAVVGAHARNFNTGSTGISVLGNFTLIQPNAQILAALDRVVGWKAGIHGFDPNGRVSINGISYPRLVGHRDVGQTACPGSISNFFPRIRANAAGLAPLWPRVSDGLSASVFSDIAGSPHETAIEALVAQGITQGYDDGTFRPQAQVTRGQVATFLARGLQIPSEPGQRFSDVAGSPHEGAIYALVVAGVIDGYADGTFRPQEPLRREHMAAILTRALDLPLDPIAGQRFPDVTAYVGEIGAIASAGITTGKSDGTFAPKETATRAQMATFLMNALALAATAAPVVGTAPKDPTAPYDPTVPTVPVPEATAAGRATSETV